MATNKPLDCLIEKARRIGRHKTKKAAVTAALEEYIKLRKQRDILKAFGTVEFDSSYDYKVEREKIRSQVSIRDLRGKVKSMDCSE